MYLHPQLQLNTSQLEAAAHNFCGCRIKELILVVFSLNPLFSVIALVLYLLLLILLLEAKHIDIRQNFIRDNVEKGNLSLSSISTDDQRAENLLMK